jgi:hypothetical protein
MKSSLLERIRLSASLITLFGLSIGCATISNPVPLTQPVEPLSRQEALLNLGIASRFHDYRERLYKVLCHSEAGDLMMGGESYHLHRYYSLSSSGERAVEVTEFFPFIEGVKSDHPMLYLFDLNGDGIYLSEDGEVVFDAFLDGLNGNELLLRFDDDEQTTGTSA